MELSTEELEKVVKWYRLTRDADNFMMLKLSDYRLVEKIIEHLKAGNQKKWEDKVVEDKDIKDLEDNFLKDEPVIFKGRKMRIIEQKQWYDGQGRATLELVEKKE